MFKVDQLNWNSKALFNKSYRPSKLKKLSMGSMTTPTSRVKPLQHSNSTPKQLWQMNKLKTKHPTKKKAKSKERFSVTYGAPANFS